MSDIFISYKREEQPIARKLADALEGEGWSVWWDPMLRAGEHFDDVIEKALNDTKCVIVLWSNLSVNSEYVKAEATEALEQHKLVPIKIESVNLPFRFKRVHTSSLLDWDDSKDFLEFRRLVEDIAAIVGSPVIEASGRPIRRKKRSTSQEVRVLCPLAARNAPKADYYSLYCTNIFACVVAHSIQDLSELPITYKTGVIRLPRLRCGAIGWRTRLSTKSHPVQSWMR